MREEDATRLGYHLWGAKRHGPARIRRSVRLRPHPAGARARAAEGPAAARAERRGRDPARSRRWWRPSAGAASAGSACRRSRSTRSSARWTAAASSTAASAPPSGKVRTRWERIAAAQRRGEAMPPIDVYRIGELHFVKDGHHRVSVARALGHKDIDAYVTEVLTELGAEREITLADLPLKSHERLFCERVPLPEEARAHDPALRRVALRGARRGVEAWGFRREQAHRRAAVPPGRGRAWFGDEYEPVVEMLQEAELAQKGTDTEAYMRVVAPALPAPAHPRLERRGDRAPARGARTPQLGRGHDGEGAPEGASLAALRGVAAAAWRPASRRSLAVRLRPSSGSNRWSRVGVDPELRLLALLHLARRDRGGPRSGPARRRSAPRRRRRPRPARAAPATRSSWSVSTVKWA